jgi:hypothetical protein
VKYILFLCLLSLFAFSPSFAAQTKSRITVASGVRVRNAPQVAAEEIERLQFGTVVGQLEQSAAKEKINQVEDYWYRVALPSGKEGWVFGGLTVFFDPGKRNEIYRKIVAERMKTDINFGDSVDLINFLTRAVTEVNEPAIVAELEFSRLRLMKRAVALIPFDKQDQQPFKSWIKTQDEAQKIVYSEPAGQWLVQSDLFWDLQKRFSSLPIADEIAWEAANNPLPGECEGYLPCHIHVMVLTEAQYLKLYPNGLFAQDALKVIDESLESFLDPKAEETYSLTKEDYPEIQRDLAAVRAVLAKTSNAKKAELIKKVDAVAKKYK